STRWYEIYPSPSEYWSPIMALHAVVWRADREKGLTVERQLKVGEWHPALGSHAWGQSLGFSPDGKRLATANFLPGGMSEVKVWDLASGQALHTVRGPGAPDADSPYLHFTRDGRRLFTGGRLWDLSTGLELLTLSEALAGGRDESGLKAFLLDGDVM